MKKIFEKYYKIVFALVALILLYPILQRGYIMLLDWMVEPNISLTDINFSIDSIGIIAYKILAIILGFGVTQRIVLFAIVFFIGTAGFRLTKRTGNIFAQYFAGLFLIFNPFLYARIIEQPNVAGGAVLFLWFLVYFLEHFEKNNSKKLILASIFGALAISFSIHNVFFIGLAMVIILGFDYLKNKNWKFILKTALVIGTIVVLLNSNWIFSFFSGDIHGVGGIERFTSADWEAFQTVEIGGHSVYTTVLALQGYWGEYQDRFVSIQDNPPWSFAFILIFVLAFFGMFKLWKKDHLVKPLIILFWVAFVLAVGVASPLFKPLILFLYQYAPLYIGLREPQKWVVILVFVYAYLGSWGIKYLLEIKQLKNCRREIGIFCVLLPVIFSYSIVQGMHKHFTPHEFPLEWQAAKIYLKENSNGSKILFLPWHSYLEFDFAGKNIVNPAEPYFGKNIIWGNNTEFGSVYSHSSDPQTLTIEKYVIRKDNPETKISYENFVRDMRSLEITKVILLKAEDWRDYAWLDSINIQKVLENNKLIIYNLK